MPAQVAAQGMSAAFRVLWKSVCGKYTRYRVDTYRLRGQESLALGTLLCDAQVCLPHGGSTIGRLLTMLGAARVTAGAILHVNISVRKETHTGFWKSA